MKKFLKKNFIPHRDNGYRPGLFSDAGIGLLFSLIIIVFAFGSFASLLVSRTGLTALVLPKVLVDEANLDRQVASENFKTLAISPVLERAAQMKANDMANKGYFAHQSPDGKSPWYWFGLAGYDFSFAGENLAVNFTDSQDVNQAWMNSPGHRDNILNKNFTEIGIATAEGNYNGKQTTFVVELFGRPAVASAAITASHNTIEPKVSTTASSSVLGASGESDLFVAVEKESAPQALTASVEYSNWLLRAFSSPRKMMSIIYIVITSVILIGLLLMIFIEIKKQHPLYIMLGISLILLMIVLMYLYQSLLFGPLLIV